MMVPTVEELITLFARYTNRAELERCVSNAKHSNNFSAEVWVNGYRTLFGAEAADKMVELAVEPSGESQTTWVNEHLREIDLTRAWARTQFDVEALPYIEAILDSKFDWHPTVLGEGIRDLMWSGVTPSYFAAVAAVGSAVNYSKVANGYGEGIPVEYLVQTFDESR